MYRVIDDPHIINAIICIGLALIAAGVALMLPLPPKPPSGGHREPTPFPIFPPF